MKRGQAEVWQIDTIFQVLIGLMVAVALFSAVYEFNYSEEFSKEFFQKDVQLLVDTLRAVPDDVVVQYPIGKNSFDVKIVDGIVIIEGNKNILDILVKDKRFLTFEKKGKCISFKGVCV